MELGSLVCTARKPLCGDCPVKRICRAWRLGAVENLSAQVRASRTLFCKVVALAILRQGRVLLWRYGSAERWAMLWDFPRFEIGPGADVFALAREKASDWTSCLVKEWTEFGRFRHSVTRFRIEVRCLLAEIRKRDGPLGEPGVEAEGASYFRVGERWVRKPKQSALERTLRWVRLEELANLPLTAPARKMAGMLSRVLNGQFQDA